MYYSEVISLLKSGPSTLKARRTCWENETHISYDRNMSKVNFTRQQKIDESIMMVCYISIPSHGDLTKDDWEIFE